MAQHKDSKKRRYMALFLEAKPRLARGEAVFIALEAPTPMEIFSSEHVVRLYWGHWRKAQVFLEPASQFLMEVKLTLRILNGQYVMQLARRDIMLNAMLDGKRAHSTLLLTGHGASTFAGMDGKLEERVPEPIVLSEEKQKELDALAARAGEAEKKAWLSFCVKWGHSAALHAGAFKLKYDSPEGEKYRKRYAYRQPSASDPPQTDYLSMDGGEG